MEVVLELGLQRQPGGYSKHDPHLPAGGYAKDDPLRPKLGWRNGACFQCGQTGHRFVDCPEIKDIKAKNQGQLPPGHQTLFDKWRAEQKQKLGITRPSVSAATLVDPAASAQATGAAAAAVVPRCWCILEMPTCEPCQPITTKNTFDAVAPEDDSDDEDAVCNVIKHEPETIERILKKHEDGQLQRLTPERFAELKAQGSHVEPLTPDRIAAIESQIKNGLIRLPACAANEIWCMVDSGSAPHVANLKQHFPGAKLRPSLAQKLGIQMSTATGQPFANLGEFEVPFHTQEGHPYTTTFQNAEVSMPNIVHWKDGRLWVYLYLQQGRRHHPP